MDWLLGFIPLYAAIGCIVMLHKCDKDGRPRGVVTAAVFGPVALMLGVWAWDYATRNEIPHSCVLFPYSVIVAIEYVSMRLAFQRDRTRAINVSGTTDGPTPPTGAGGSRSAPALPRDAAGEPSPGALRRVAEVVG